MIRSRRGIAIGPSEELTSYDLVSGAFSVSNTFLTSTTAQTLLSSAFSVSNTFLASTTAQTLLSSAFSVSNTFLTSTTAQTLLSSAFSLSNTFLTPTLQQMIGPAVSVLNVNPSAPLSQQKISSLTQSGAGNRMPGNAPALSVSLDAPRNGQSLVEGQTISVAASVSALFLGLAMFRGGAHLP